MNSKQVTLEDRLPQTSSMFAAQSLLPPVPRSLFTVHCLFPFLLALCPCRGQEIPFTHVIVDDNNPPNPHCKAVADINGDGFPDILAASSTGDSTGLFWYAYPNWDKHMIATGSFSTDMQTGDVDRDGDLDVIIPKGVHTGSTMWWYENPRPGYSPSENQWAEHKIADAGAHDVEIADLNGDGKLDVVVRLGDATILLQKTPNSWTKVPINSGGRGGLTLGDINDDSRIDIVMDGYWLEAPVHHAEGQWKKHLFADGWEGRDVGVTLADLNHDGRPDILIAPAESDGKLAWYEAPEDPSADVRWIEHVIDPAVSHIHTFKVADMDLDGDTDVITAEMHQSPLRRVSVYLNDGDATNWKAQVVATTGSHNLRVADIDSDGDMDIVGANWNNNSPTHGVIELWRNDLKNQGHR